MRAICARWSTSMTLPLLFTLLILAQQLKAHCRRLLERSCSLSSRFRLRLSVMSWSLIQGGVTPKYLTRLLLLPLSPRETAYWARPAAEEKIFLLEQPRRSGLTRVPGACSMGAVRIYQKSPFGQNPPESDTWLI